MQSSSAPLSFPEHIAQHYANVRESITYQPEIHLDLGWPSQIVSLEELGYTKAEIDECASPVAFSSAFQVLSREGIQALRQICLGLQAGITELAGNRVPRHVAGAVYRSKFMRDFCACPVVADHLSKISGTALVPHTMPSQQLYINYAPTDLSQAVDAWHYDGIGFDYVLMVSDPADFEGGEFEIYRGTRQSFADRHNMDLKLVRLGVVDDMPAGDKFSYKFGQPGQAVFQQGNMVVHRAAPLLAPAERITMVPGYVSLDFSKPDPTATHDMPRYNQPGIVDELIRHVQWRCAGRMWHLTNQLMSQSERLRQTEEILGEVGTTLNHIKQGQLKGPFR